MEQKTLIKKNKETSDNKRTIPVALLSVTGLVFIDEV
jgi:hypothetical protein